MKKTALITGITGQDGAYLAKYLLEKDWRVFGTFRTGSTFNSLRLEKLGVLNKIELVDLELLDITNIINVIKKVKPEAIYNLAAQSFVDLSFEQPVFTSEVNAVGVTRILEAIKTVNPKIKFYQASTSEMFGNNISHLLNENTPFYPKSPYGASKLYAHWISVNYRESYNMFVCCGILFNHESPLRGDEFVTKKIVSGLTKIKYKKQNILKLGNLEAKRDWGFAGDYVDGMFKMMNSESPSDFVLATGKAYSVREFCETTALNLNIKLEWHGKDENTVGINASNGEKIILIDKQFYRPAEIDCLRGDYKKAKTILNWKPKTDFNSLVKIMVDDEIKNYA